MVNKLSSLIRARTQRFLQIAIPLSLIGITGILIHVYDPAVLNSITEGIKHHPTEYLLFRWGALCSFILCWPYVAVKIGQYYGAASDQIVYWRKETWRVGVWLILIELLVCENLVSKALHLLGGA